MPLGAGIVLARGRVAALALDAAARRGGAAPAVLAARALAAFLLRAPQGVALLALEGAPRGGRRLADPARTGEALDALPVLVRAGVAALALQAETLGRRFPIHQMVEEG